MTQEEKQLLFKDLCARLPYGVKLGFENSDLILVPTDFNIYTMQLSTNQIYPKSNSVAIGRIYDIWSYRPYLRPMSSMTEEEKDEFNHVFELELAALEEPAVGHTIKSAASNAFVIDFYNRHHFDYRGLIPMGLAIAAPKNMYKTK